MRTDVCGACKFWQPADTTAAEEGECRRRPPRVYLIPTRGSVLHGEFKPVAAHPPTHATSWCGEFEEGDTGDGVA